NAAVNNPDAANGITLTVEIDDLLLDAMGAPLHRNRMAFQPGPGVMPGGCNTQAGTSDSDFDILKGQWFGNAAERANPLTVQAKRLAYRYAIFAHQLEPQAVGGVNQDGTSGCSELWGDDVVVTLGNPG